MPALGRLKALAQDKVTQGTCEYEGETIAFAFAGGRITGEDVQAYIAAAEVDQPGLLTELLAKVLVSWDVTHEDGSDFPPTIENLNTLPLEVQVALFASLGRAARAAGEGQGSFAGG